MDCRERERLDSALNAVVNRRDRLNKVSRGNPNFGQHKQEIEELSKRVDQAQQDLQAHKDWHGCS
jgi:hypothetical protein